MTKLTVAWRFSCWFRDRPQLSRYRPGRGRGLRLWGRSKPLELPPLLLLRTFLCPRVGATFRFFHWEGA